MKKKTETAETYYDAAARSYNKLYSFEELINTNIYPANYFRLQKLINCFLEPKYKRIIEIGLGEGTPALTLSKAGKSVYGFDVSTKMVKEAQKRLVKAGIPKENVICADINDPISYIQLMNDGPFDGLVAMGVLQHMEKDEYVLNNMASLLKPGGRAFIMFRNQLFSLFTFNRLTKEFIVNDLLVNVGTNMKKEVEKYLDKILRIDLPPPPKQVVTTKKILDKPVFSKFHNPFEVLELFGKVGFKSPRLHWYHYHPAMPSLEKENSKLFKEEAIRLEHEMSSWRGMFLCSAFIVEAEKN